MSRVHLPSGARRMVIVAVSAAAAAFGLSPVVASASSVPPMPYFVEWVPGTPLPTIPAGYHIEAWPSQPPAGQLLTAGQATATVALSAQPTSTQMSALTAVQPDASGIVNLEVLPGASACGTKFLRNVGSEATNVLQSYSTISGMSQTFTYGSGQSSSLGVGISYSGESAGFSASGTVSVSTSSSQGFPTQSGAAKNHWESYFEVGEWVTACSTGGYYTVKAYQWNGGDAISHPSGAPGATHCVPELNGSTFTQNTTRASTFAVGFNVYGFNAQSTTGYDGSAEISFHYTQNAQLCGTVNDPGASGPGVLVAS
jgi:hypothetical protein